MAFTWRDTIQIDFGGGVIAELPNDVDIIQNRLLGANEKLSKAVRNLDANDPNSDAKALNMMLGAIEDIFGAETAARIFEGHKLNANNIVGVYLHTYENAMKQTAAYLGAFDRLNQTGQEIEARVKESRKMRFQPSEETKQRVIADLNERLQASVPTPTASGLRIPLANP